MKSDESGIWGLSGKADPLTRFPTGEGRTLPAHSIVRIIRVIFVRQTAPVLTQNGVAPALLATYSSGWAGDHSP